MIYDDLAPAAKRLSRIPRIGRLLGHLPEDRLSQIETQADAYHECLTFVAADLTANTGLIDSGLQSQVASWLGRPLSTEPESNPLRSDFEYRQWQMRFAKFWLAAIAFQMQLGDKDDGTASPNFDTASVSQLKHAAFRRLVASGHYTSFSGNPLLDTEDQDQLDVRLVADWRRLNAMNSLGLEQLLLGDTDNRVFFSDRTLQSYLAAYWVAHVGDEATQAVGLQWLARSESRESHSEGGFEAEGLYETARMLVEMPTQSGLDDPWHVLMDRLYEPMDENSFFRRRPSEWILRTHERLRGREQVELFFSEFARLSESGTEAQRSAAAEVLGRGTDLDLIRLPKGDPESAEFGLFEMGDENNPEACWHWVRLTRPYCLHRYAVTNRAYELFDSSRREHRSFSYQLRGEDDTEDLSNHPVVNVNWFDAVVFCLWLGRVKLRNRDNGTEREVSFRIPTEAEWEYACRGGLSREAYNWGGVIPHGEITPQVCCYLSESTRQVDAFAPNSWGFYQFHGNVHEWCWDYYGSCLEAQSVSPILNPIGPAFGSDRVLRGGSWRTNGENCRAGFRFRSRPGLRLDGRGFRLACNIHDG